MQTANKKVVIVGAGPAGLTAAYQVCKKKIKSVVLEKDVVVGGISRTVNYKGYLFDIGGHRFFTKVKAVDEMWREVLGDEKFLRRSRLSRIYYNKKFFYYPLRAANALLGLGIFNSFLTLGSYVHAQMFPIKPETTFEHWICNRFGKRLYLSFFKTYTEKVWGIPCNEISADWAAQRIKGLSLIATIKNAILATQAKDKSEVIKTLIDAFDYPEKGPGQMWEMVADSIQKQGSELKKKSSVEKIIWRNGKVTALEIECDGEKDLIEGTDFISSMPIRELIQKMEPKVPEEVSKAAEQLGYRDFLTVSLIVNKADLFQDNWIYIHDSTVKVGRIQNFKNWSPQMVPDPNKTCLGLEYFCFEGDGLWTMSDEDLIALATKELDELGLVKTEDVEDGAVVRIPKAYPVYDGVYVEALTTIREFLGTLGNLHLVGRNGMHKYNNQDHSMLTAMLAVENILGANYDVWEVNVDNEYHEEVKAQEETELAVLASTQPMVPKRIA
jgi:protoporphyrinogen oxidase